jgi:predicted 3-demethylubiquinone-9 3-methyltransferase (glyoxalase superfamily)
MSQIHSQKITPFLWFDTQAEEAAKFYTSIFKNSRIGHISHYGEGTPMPKGTVLVVEFELDGVQFMALNAGPQFHFTEAISFLVSCESQEEIDHYWKKLSAGGTEIQCGWLKDRYGLAWQIVPAIFFKFVNDPDPEKSQRVMNAMMKMIKMDIEGLKRAYEGK